MRVQQLDDPRFGFRLVFAADGDAEKRDAELLCDVFEIRMIRDNERNFAFQRAFALFDEQVVKTVRRFRDEHRHARNVIGIVYRPFESERFSEFRKACLKFAPRNRKIGQLELETHEVLSAHDVGVLLAVHDVESGFIEKVGNARDKPLAVHAADQKNGVCVFHAESLLPAH